MNTKAYLALLLLFGILFPALGQTQTQTPSQTQKPVADDKDDVVRINTNLVQVDAVVTKDGKLVNNLTADDFEIYEDGKRQTITSFAYISNVPNATPQPPTKETKKATPVVPFSPLKAGDARRTMAFVVDDLGLSAESMYQVKKQLRKFVTEQLQPNDLVAIIRTSGELGALQQFTNDKRILTRAVDQLHWNICSRIGVHVLPTQIFQCNWSTARVRMRLSFVNCCSAPSSPLVRMIATRSFGCSCSVTNLRNCFFTWYMLSAESPRSSTTKAIVRLASPALRGLKGTTGVAFFVSLVGGWGVALGTFEMYAKLVIVWRLPSS